MKMCLYWEKKFDYKLNWDGGNFQPLLYCIIINPIHLDILRFRVKTMPQIKRKWQGMPNWQPLKANRVKHTACNLILWPPWYS